MARDGDSLFGNHIREDMEVQKERGDLVRVDIDPRPLKVRVLAFIERRFSPK